MGCCGDLQLEEVPICLAIKSYPKCISQSPLWPYGHGMIIKCLVDCSVTFLLVKTQSIRHLMNLWGVKDDNMLCGSLV